jgi:hypothetical protein
VVDTEVLTLGGFLMQRIAEDEAWALELAEASPAAWMTLPVALLSLARFDSARVLAECEAKRRVVNRAIERGLARDEPPEGDQDLRALAAVYAGHPSYSDSWRADA